MLDPDKVENKALPARKDDGTLSRTDTKALIQAIMRGYIDAQHNDAPLIRSTLREVMEDPKSRQRVDAAKAYSQMAGDAAKVFEIVDKIERLDGGEATENIRIVQYVVDKGPNAGS